MPTIIANSKSTRMSGGLRLLLVMIAVSAAVFAPAVSIASEQSKPNILLIITDQQFGEAMSCRMGREYIHTPAMDSLADQGMLFSRAFTANPLCMPARTALFTGRYPHETGVTRNDASTSRLKSPEFTCMGTLFRAAGYQTAYFGKWHLPYPAKNTASHGFKTISVSPKQNHDVTTSAAAAEFLGRKHDKPFLLVVSFMNPHNICEYARRQTLPDGPVGQAPSPERCPPVPANLAPQENEPDTITMIRRGYQANPMFPVGGFTADDWRQLRWGYYRLIEKVDAQIGIVLEALRKAGLEERTAIVFSSDHGECAGAHRFNQKTVFYEESVRVPLIISQKGRTPKGTCDRLVNTGVDILPTVLHIAGIEVPHALKGRSLRALAAGETVAQWRDHVVLEDHMDQTLAVDGVRPSAQGRMVRTERYKYCVYDRGNRRESLVDLHKDPGETVNLAGDAGHRDVLVKHRELLAGFAREHHDALAAALAADPLRPVAWDAADLRIDAAFPGGNILVDRIEGDRVFLRPDLRDTQSWWFYWCFRVRGAADRTLTFEFTDGNPIGVRGPAISTDGGNTWSWLGTESVKGASFSHAFGAGAGDVRFAYAIPYVEADLQRFLRPLREHPHLKLASMGRTGKGRNIEALYLGRIAGEPDCRVLLTARHHACETMASFVLEGVIASILQDAEQQWLRDHVEFLVVPLVDKDGVEQGDQGKLRAPHDPNRDYSGKSIYPAVAALREHVPRWSSGRLRVALDLHCPYIRGARNEVIYFVGSRNERVWSEVQRFSEMLESLPPRGLPYHTRDNLPYGQEWNTAANYGDGMSMAGWAAGLPGARVVATIEIPYANASGKAVTPESARAFGRDLCGAIHHYLAQKAHRD